ncbi:MAG: hypothetical protein PHS54_04680 [Clostridia bacterium]|nr:hypothetical protein [Clostridia bacterium]
MKRKPNYLLCLLLLAIVAVFFWLSDVDVNSSDGNLLSEYLLGETINIPKGKVFYDGIEYPASDHYVIFPDHHVYHLDSITFEQPGEYEIVYYSKLYNRILKSSKKIIVREDVYRLSSSRSNYYYGKSKLYENIEGLVVSLAGGDTLYYNKIVDISNQTYLNPIINMIITPEFLGSEDAQHLLVTFTDAHNSNNSLTVTLKKNLTTSAKAPFTSYVTAGSSGQSQTGIERHSSGTIIYDGFNYKLHSSNQYGSFFYLSFTGEFSNEREVGSEIYGISLDNETKKVYVHNGNDTNPLLVTDLDEKLFYSNIWTGFTNGEVYISISASSYVGSTMNFVIKDILDVPVDDNLTFIPQNAPVISVDCENTLPEGKLGGTYPVFSAFAYSPFDNKVEISERVYYSYYSEARVEIEINKERRFQTKYQGNYYIVYSAKDCFGNYSEKVLIIDVKPDVETINISLEPKSYSGIAGEVIEVAEPIVTGYYLDYNLEIKAKLKTNSNIVYDISPSELSFQPLYSGVYEITYSGSDLINTVEEVYEITVDLNNKPVFLDFPVMPKYLVANCEYQLEEVQTVNFSNGYPVKNGEIEISVTEIYENSTKTISLNSFLYKVPNCQSVIISYLATNEFGAAEISYQIDVINYGYGEQIDLSKCFVTDADFIVQAESMNLNFTIKPSNSNDGKASLTYFNSLPANDFSFTFNVLPAYNEFNAIDLYLNDSQDNGIELKITYRKHSINITKVYINDIYACDIEANFYSISEQFRVDYNNDTLVFSPVFGKNVELDELLGEEAFNGFPSEKLYLKIEFTEISGESGITIYQILGQRFTNQNYDIIGPVIDINSLIGLHKINSEVIIKRTIISDVIDPNISCSFRVTDPEQNIVESIDGIILDANADVNRDYIIKLTKFGKYLVSYYAIDSSGNETYYTYSIYVPDSEKPVIILEDICLKGTIGKEITLAKAVISDNVSESPTLLTIVKDPYGKMTIQNGKKFIPIYYGQYTVYFYGIDEQGNYTIESYEVEVT